MNSTKPYPMAAAVSMLLFSLYLLSFSGTFHVMDELAVFTAANSIAQHGRPDINPLIWTNHWTPNPPGIWGIDNNLYTKKPPGISLLAAPLIELGHALPSLNAVHLGLLTNNLVTALTAALLLLWLHEWGYHRNTALLTALAYGTATLAMVYARMFWESSLLALCFVASLSLARPARRTARASLLCGLLMALSMTLRFEAAAAAGLVGLYLLHAPRRRLTRLSSYLLPQLLSLALLASFNMARFGSLSETGYTQEILFRMPWVGAFGLLFSPGRGLFLFSPLLLLLFLGLRPAWRRLPPADFWLISGLCLFYWLFYGSWFAWGGTWGWGPRFLLPILPLLMLFVAEPLEQWRTTRQRNWGALIGMLLGLSWLINLLGVAVDFNEHFLRLNRNDNFLFNWAAFPPLAHWQILQEGLVDIIWLHETPTGLQIIWRVLLPPMLMVLLSGGLLGYGVRHTLRGRTLISISLIHLLLTGLFLHGTASLPRQTEQTQADWPLLTTLNQTAHAEEALLVTQPPFGDVQELTTLLLGYLDVPLPLYQWIESPPKAITAPERERVWRAVTTEAEQLWLFERWLTQDEATRPTAEWLNRNAFIIKEAWLPHSGRLSHYAIAAPHEPPSQVGHVAVPFLGGITLQQFALFDEAAAGEPLKLRLTWHAPDPTGLAAQGLPASSINMFGQLLAETTQQNVAQIDRALLDLQNFRQSPLLPGQTVTQGYALQLPEMLPAGRYLLVCGLYQTASGQRLPRMDNPADDFLYLTTIEISGGR